jgi:hypothetical protein
MSVIEVRFEKGLASMLKTPGASDTTSGSLPKTNHQTGDPGVRRIGGGI